MSVLSIIRYCRRTKTVFAVVMLFGIARKATSSTSSVPLHPQPTFVDIIPNVTVLAGSDVSLPCTVENLGSYRIAWSRKDENTLLSIQTRVIIRNSKYRVTHNNHRIWYLHIDNVQAKDTGQYMCQINTTPMISQTGFLQVLVPPSIDEEQTSSDMQVREGSDVTLKCIAKGAPNPDIKWRREDEVDIPVGKDRENIIHGNSLNLTKVSRLDMGAYLCMATNGVHPPASKRIQLSVNFPPMVWIPNQLIGAPLGSDITLDCNLELHPRAVTFWTKEHVHIVSSGTKFDSLDIVSGSYKVQMKLIIHNLNPEDFGAYTCVAKNSLGETKGTIRLYEIPPPTTADINSHQVSPVMKSKKLQNGENTSELQSFGGYSKSARFYNQSNLLSPSILTFFYLFRRILERRTT
ncbi:lachesin-like isoform X2 [Stegodyphus dumicola]|uniref:lachesin-like isoform X2 n=1 Tax=Stegodyphus dumicola TaxID=202533 RepID=UPI0015A9B366|nr:lachesin-like isoform X2 [Stegodyphus dumicola]